MKKFFDFENTDLKIVAFFFALSGVALYFANKKMKMGTVSSIDLQQVTQQITYKKALYIGIAQGLAVLPGLSRSGSTIATGLLMSCTPQVAAFYSFAISIPAVIGACILELPQATVNSADVPYYALGTVVSFVVGLASLALLRFLFTKKTALVYFSYYLWALSIGMLFF